MRHWNYPSAFTSPWLRAAVFSFAATASVHAQGVACSASASTPAMVRAESYTDFVSDIVLSCTASSATTMDISAQFNTNVTSRLLNSPLSEALLLLDDPAAAQQVACSGATCTNGVQSQQNVFQGAVAASTVSFSSVRMPSGTHTFRLTDIRVNGTALSAKSSAAQVSAVVSATAGSGSVQVPIASPSQVVAFVEHGIAFQMRAPDDARAFSGSGVSQCSASVQCRLAVLRFAEQFATAAKPRTTAPYNGTESSPAPATQATPGVGYDSQSESGFYNPAFPGSGGGGKLSTAGLADSGTRLKVTLNGIPAGMTLYVSTLPVTFSGGAPAANTLGSEPVARLVAQETGPFAAVPQTTTIEGIPALALSPVNGSVTAVWEVLNASPAALEDFDFLVWITYSAPLASPLTIRGGAAPDQYAFAQGNWPVLGLAQDATFAIPRFQANGPVNLFAAGDYNSDGHGDLVWMNHATRQVVVHYFGGPQGTTDLGWGWLNSSGAAGWTLVAAADFDGNGVPDLVWQNDSTSQVVVHYMGGTGGTTDLGWAWLNIAGAPGWKVAGAADFDGNGVPDLVWLNPSTRQVVVHFFGGTGGATDLGWAWLNSSGAPGWTCVGAADFDGNGVPDLVWLNDSTRQVVVHYFGGPQGTADIGWAYLNSSGAPGWTLVGAEDLDGNGVPDLIWLNDTTQQVVAHFFSGSGGTTDIGWAWMNSAGAPGWTAVVPH